MELVQRAKFHRVSNSKAISENLKGSILDPLRNLERLAIDPHLAQVFRREPCDLSFWQSQDCRRLTTTSYPTKSPAGPHNNSSTTVKMIFLWNKTVFLIIIDIKQRKSQDLKHDRSKSHSPPVPRSRLEPARRFYERLAPVGQKQPIW